MRDTPKRWPEPLKKQYEKPQLEVYGDIRDIAAKTSRSGQMDGGFLFRTRTD